MVRFAIIGLGRFGTKLATLLGEGGVEVIAIDHRKELVDALRDKVTLAVCLDSTDEEALRSQGIDKVDVAIVGIGGNFENNMLTTVILKQIGVARVISRATTEMRGRILSRVGADDLVNPEQESAERWSHRLIAPEIMERIELAEGYTLAQLAAPERFVGKTLEQLEVRNKYHVNVVAIRRTTQRPDSKGKTRARHFVLSVPMPDTVIERGDVLLVIGSDEAIHGFPKQ